MVSSLDDDDSKDQRSAKGKISRMIDGLETYAAQHFATEEELFLHHGRPRSDPTYVNQHDTHVKFVDFVQQQKKTLGKTPGKKALIAVANFVKDWLVTHIIQHDQPELAQLISGKSIDYNGHASRLGGVSQSAASSSMPARPQISIKDVTSAWDPVVYSCGVGIIDEVIEFIFPNLSVMPDVSQFVINFHWFLSSFFISNTPLFFKCLVRLNTWSLL